MPRPPGMGHRPKPLFLAVLLFLSQAGVAAGQHGAASDNGEGALHDVAVFSAACMVNESCEAERPTHLIEYFSADWCEPCVQVSDHLRNSTNGTESHIAVIQHHPSPVDLTYFSPSKLRNDADYRLLFLPSLVVDGTHLLTGTRQALDLNDVMDGKKTQWSGLQTMTMANGTLTWNNSLVGTISAWYVAPVPHETSGVVHPSVAYHHQTANASAGELVLNESIMLNGTSLVVLLETAGVRNLTVASLSPTGSMDLNSDVREDAKKTASQTESMFAALLGALLVLALLPAIITHINLTRGTKGVQGDKLGSEE